jgi:hypothetical protein
MPNRILVLLMIIACSSATRADDPIAEWGKISEAEWAITVPADYPDAEAIVIFDDGLAIAEPKGKEFATGLEYHRHTRLKVFSQEGIERVKDIVIDHFHYDKLYRVKAQIIHPNGDISKVPKGAIYETETGDRRQHHIEFDDLSPGDILEYTYRINYYGGYDKLGPEVFFLFGQEMRYNTWRARDKALGIPADVDDLLEKNVANVPTWFFDHQVYCLQSRFALKLGSDIDYSYFTTNVPTERAEPVSERIKLLWATVFKKHTWLMENIPPFESDSSDFIDDEVARCGLHFQLFSTVGKNRVLNVVFTDEHWQHIGESIQGYLKRYVKKTKSMKRKVRDLVAETESTRARVEVIYNHVSSEFQIDSTGFVLRPKHSNLKSLYKEKTGMRFEINLLLLEMLTMAGIEAWPVLISTKNKISFRRTCEFNHMLVFADIDGAGVFLDASEKGCSVGELPPICLSGEGVLVDYNSSRLCLVEAEMCDVSSDDE